MPVAVAMAINLTALNVINSQAVSETQPVTIEQSVKDMIAKLSSLLTDQQRQASSQILQEFIMKQQAGQHSLTAASVKST